MDPDLPQTPAGFNDIDLNDYIPNHRSYNTIVYYHKNLYANLKKNKTHTKAGTGKPVNKIKGKKKRKFDSETLDDKSTQTHNVDQTNFDLNKSIKFTNNIVPLPIPKHDTPLNQPLYFTIKTTKKHKKNTKKAREQNIDDDLLTPKQEKPRNLEIVETRASRNQSHSVEELLDPSSQNTLDDLHLNINQSSSYSEMSEPKCRKRVHSDEKRVHNSKKYLISSSMDALATELCNGESSKIKIQLMNESDKISFCESIKVPICTSIKEFLSKTPHECHVYSELETLHKTLKWNNQKLDEMLQRLTCIEKKLIDHAEIRSFTTKQADTTERSNEAEDIHIGDNLSEEYDMCERRVRARDRSVVIPFDESLDKKFCTKETKDYAGEAQVTFKTSNSVNQLGEQFNRPNKVLTRFCWTDTDKKK